ncbi:alpha/beta hydrolase family protein [Streptomyces sp. NPDC090493]|uniref:alpha/beta hydrolase family protein n=1 Tax=Streptomyces sp. NPDC090493 TaxID=3365964 RepID=UPI0037F6DB65
MDPLELIDERAGQWISLGVAPPTIAEVRTKAPDLWSDEPDGWVHEWSAAAREAESSGDLQAASLLYGVAKFPVLGNRAHREAYDSQLRTYLLAAKASDGFGDAGFERHRVDVDFRGSTVQVPTHLFAAPGLPADAPLVLALSGVDTWKVELHNLALVAARVLGARVAVVDMAGTGESPVANGPDGDRYLAGVLDWLRRRFPQGRRTGAIGLSFGGHWTTKLALTARVDAAVSCGGLVADAFEAESVSQLRFGMRGIFGNSLWLDTEPSLQDVISAMESFSLRRQGLLEDWGAHPAALLSFNGTDDPHVPQSDVTVLADRPNTVTRLVPDSTHCAAEKFSELMPWALEWLRGELA